MLFVFFMIITYGNFLTTHIINSATVRLFTILYHGCMSAIKEQIKQRNTCDIEDYANAFSYNNTVDVEREELKQALNRLSEDDRNIVLLSVVVGLNSKEIAKITGFTAGNVRQRLSRSLSKMKRYLS